MCHIDGGEPDLAVDSPQLGTEPGPDLGVDVGQRLVEEGHRRLRDQGPRQGGTLGLAAAHRPGVLLPEPSQTDELQVLVGAPQRRSLLLALDSERVGDVGLECHVRPQGVGLEHHVDVALVGRERDAALAVEDGLAPDGDGPGIRVLETGETSEQGRLATPAGPEQDQDLLLIEGQVDIVDRRHLGPAAADEGLVDVADLDPGGPRRAGG